MTTSLAENFAKIINARCSYCGQPIPCGNAECIRHGREKRERENAEREEREKRERIQRIRDGKLRKFEDVGFVRRYYDFERGHIMLDDLNRQGVNYAFRWSSAVQRNAFNVPRLLYLEGETGSGKTLLSHIVTREVLESKPMSFKLAYLSIREAAQEKTILWSSKGDEKNPVYQAHKDADLMVIDDLGYEGERPARFFIEWLNAVVDGVFRSGTKLLIITSEWSVDKFLQAAPYGRSTPSLCNRLNTLSDGYYHPLA